MGFIRVATHEGAASSGSTCLCGTGTGLAVQDRRLGFTSMDPDDDFSVPKWLIWALAALAALFVSKLLFDKTPAGRRRKIRKASEKARARHRRELAEIREDFA